MAAPHENGELPEAWKTKFASMRPIIPAMLYILVPVAVMSFGEPCFAIPWLIVILYLVSGTFLLMLVLKKQRVGWEKWTLIAILLNMLIAFQVIAVCFIKLLLLSLLLLKNSPDTFSFTEVLNQSNLYVAELGLAALEFGICAWICRILQEARKTLVL